MTADINKYDKTKIKGKRKGERPRVGEYSWEDSENNGNKLERSDIIDEK